DEQWPPRWHFFHHHDRGQLLVETLDGAIGLFLLAIGGPNLFRSELLVKRSSRFQTTAPTELLRFQCKELIERLRCCQNCNRLWWKSQCVNANVVDQAAKSGRRSA